MPGFVDVLIIGDDKGVQAMLHRLDTALNPVAIVAFLGGTVDAWFRQRAQSRFANEGDEVVGSWAPLSFATQQIRSQLGYGPAHPINVRTTELERYIVDATPSVVATATGALYTTPGSPASGKLKQKMEAAQRGLASPPTPARPVLGMGETDMAFILEALAYHVEGRGRVPSP